ncbi:protein ENL [Copidosoma floridanum]|uniref:protein ENL n=1 Tax=Copidosoma floridanum TaxID=29053 RepID=UPI000C6FC1B1|nr:protein ENL [Copidosoma floridanum]
MQKYRISLECGDTSSLRSKKTSDGFTHDWKVWIKGANDAPIHHYIDKVVFNLHETFPKPKRVIKEPPYCLTESGYAGFEIPIQVYLKNRNEPKRFDILYNLNLDTSTPTVSHRSLHNEIIVNPTEEFRKKLLKGGAVPTNVGNTLEKNETKTMSLVGKPKLSGNSEARKRKIAESKTSNQFTDLFGPPIKTAKLTHQEDKKTVSHASLHEVIVNPTEGFRKKLMKGGAVPTNVGNPLEKNQTKTLSLVGKPKLSGNSEARKRKIVEPKTSNQFNDIFGPPIKIAKLTQQIKKTSDKVDKSTKVKHSHHKDSKKDKSSEEKKEKKEKEKDRVKDKEKSKDKSKRSSSPSVSKASQHSSDKRPSKDKTSSLAPTVKRLSSPSSKPKEKESKKHPKKDRDRRKEEKLKGSSKSTRDEVRSGRSGKESKSDRKEERKKHEGDRDKEKKDKVRDKSEDKKRAKRSKNKVEKSSKGEKKSETKLIKEEKKSPKTLKEDVKPKEEKILKPEKIEKSEKEKSKESKSEKSDKSQNKYTSKDKKEKRDGSREKEKKDNREKSKSSSESKSSKITHPILMSAPM